MIAPAAKNLSDYLANHLTSVYMQLNRPELLELSEQLVPTMHVPSLEYHKPSHNYWDQADSMLIIYGDSLSESHQKITANTEKFLDNQSWHDLITGSVLSPDTQMEMMATYPTVWISNTGIR